MTFEEYDRHTDQRTEWSYLLTSDIDAFADAYGPDALLCVGVAEMECVTWPGWEERSECDRKRIIARKAFDLYTADLRGNVKLQGRYRNMILKIQLRKSI